MGNAFKHRRAVAALVVLLACSPFVFTLDPSLDVNQYSHMAWKVRDGFFKAGINAIAQTRDGYLWLGTQFGLLRFDGAKNVPWQPAGEQQLPSNNIMSLLATSDGTLWIGTWNGLASWKDGKLRNYAEIAGHYIYKILEDRNGVIWAGAGGTQATSGLLCAIQNGSARCYGEDGSLGRGVIGLFEDSKGNLWAGVKSGLWRWKPGPPKFYPFTGEPDGIQALGEDADGTFLVGWNDGIYRFVDGKTEPYPLPGISRQFKPRSILRDRDGGLWIGTASQSLLHVHRGKADVFAQSDGLSADLVNELFEDREGNIWIATTNGLDRFRKLPVTTLTANQGLSNAFVLAVLADKDGSLWLSTRDGLNRWDNGQIKSYSLGRGQLEDHPESLFQDDHGRIWVATVRGIGYLENGKLIPVSGVPGGNILSITQDKADNLWVANESLGLYRISPQGNVREIPWTELGHNDYASILNSDPAGNGVWIGFFLGGIAYVENGQVRRSYSAADGLAERRVSSFHFGHDGTLWVTTEGGLSRLKNGVVSTLTSKNGLPCDTIHWITEDDDHSFWLYMACGLARMNRSQLEAWISDPTRTIQVTVFESSDGVRSLAAPNHYNPQVAKSQDGRLWFLPSDGVSVIDPRHIPFNKLLPPVHVEQITADGKTYDVTSTASGTMRLPPLIRNLEVDYTALSFVAPEKVLFRYKLEGHEDWQQAGTRRQAFYNDLAPGNYHFRVAACNNSGVWNEDGAIFNFSIAPAYYQTTWFQALCGAVVIALIWSIFQLRQRQLQQQFNMRLEARVNERTRIARELHDTLLQSFHGLMFRFQAARNMLPRRAEEAMQALDGAIGRAEEAIAESRSAIQDLRSAVAAPADLAQSLTAIAQEIAARNSGHDSPVFRVIVEGERRRLSPAFKDEVCRIARELLQNAFQHARAREIEAEVRYERRMLHLLVRDDGKGIDAKVLEQGGRPGHWGLPGIRERAQQIGAKLDFWSEAGAGTEIQLAVPANIAYEKSQEGSGFRLFRNVKSHEQS